MTCIVGYINKKTGKITMGADSAGIAGLDLTVRKDSKIFRKGNFIIGCTSSFRMIQILEYSFKPPKVKKKDIYKYMCTDFIDEVRKCFKDGGFLRENNKKEAGGVFLVAYKNRLFKIENDFQVGENLKNYDAVGCGEPYALGTLFAVNKQDLDDKEKVTMALKAASKFSAGVCKPFHIYQT